MDDGRYIIMPAGMRDDARLQLSHMRVALVLGSYSKRRGWTDLSQKDIGEIAGISRQTVNEAVSELVDWGWVSRRKKSGKNQYIYRFIMDQDDYCQLETTVPENCRPEPTKQCRPKPTGNVASDPTFIKEDSSTYKDQLSSARDGACDESATPSRALKARPALRITRSDVSWSDWLESVDEQTAARMEAAGEFEATARWPSVEGARIVRLAGTSITNRIIGENGA